MDPTRLSRSTIRFNIANRGIRRIADHRNRRRYRELLRETPQWNAELKVEQAAAADWIIVALLCPQWTHGRHGLERNILGNGYCWDSEDEAWEYLDQHDDELRLELVENLFTMGLCTRCEDIVPVFGDYVAFASAGMVVCGPCLSDGENETAGPAILHP